MARPKSLLRLNSLTDTEQQIRESAYSNITVGTVVDTNDPHQMGRLRVACPAFGDFPDRPEMLPWCQYGAPFGGASELNTRGPEDAETDGRVGYGMWAIPAVGAQVLVVCIDGNPDFRVWLGCLYPYSTPHTMPHGRYTKSDDVDNPGEPEGPLSSTEKPIQPLYDNLKSAFGPNKRGNHEWKTRGADYSVSRLESSRITEYTESQLSDDPEQGYSPSRHEPDRDPWMTDKQYHSQTVALTSPGFHSITMDDRIDNGRIRIRSTSGHQVIFDDTNERIYVSTAEGKNWIELDKNGNIDVYTERRLSVHAAKDMNFTTDETFRVHAKKGIHLHSDDEVRITATKDVNVKTEANIRTRSAESTMFDAGTEIHTNAGTHIYTTAGNTLHVKGSGVNLQSTATFDILASGNLTQTGSRIDLNGPSASSATPAGASSPAPAYWTNRVPLHEPWARTLTADEFGFTHEPQLPYDDPSVGKKEGSETIPRNPHWKR